jgi:hypothetical protein
VRTPLVTAPAALRERMSNPAQLPATAPEAELPPYLASFCAHLRLLVGVPLEYLVPDERLLPPESIRFFYLDRSWTDRLVDGLISVGELGTREQGHHQAQNPALAARLDGLESYVRDLQRGLTDFETARDDASGTAATITGFLLRSAAVAGWPQMEVRAFDRVLEPYPDLSSTEVEAARVPLLRLERLSPSIMLALFAGVPRLVWCEEPHHGVQFGVKVFSGVVSVLRRQATGVPEQTAPGGGPPQIPVPFRRGGQRVVHLAALRQRLKDAASTDPSMPAQAGSADFAVELLDLPWRQRFQGAGGIPEVTGSKVFTASVEVVHLASEAVTAERLDASLQQPPPPPPALADGETQR